MNKNSIFYAVLFIVVTLAGCGNTNRDYTEDHFDVICLDGYQHWIRSTGSRGMLTVRLNEDGTPMKCKRARYYPGGNRL